MMIKNVKQYFLGLLAIATIASLTACGRTAPVKEYQSEPVPTNITSAAQVAKAIKLAGASLGWIISDAGEGKLKGTLNLREHQAIISIPYTDTSYSLLYLSSVNLKYNASENTIHKNYNGWLTNLNNKIQFYLTTAK
jgi:hypothetical protein